MPIGASALLSSKLVPGAKLVVYEGAPHGMCTTLKDRVNETQELLGFHQGLNARTRKDIDMETSNSALPAALLPVLHRGVGIHSSGLVAWARKARADTMGIVQLIKSEAAKTPITIHRLRGGVAVLEGSGGNVAVLTGSDGKVLIDAGIGVSRPQMLTALAASATSRSRT